MTQSLDRWLLDLVRPLEVGGELYPGARLVGTSTELGLRLTFDVDGEEVHAEIELAEPGTTRRHAARTARFLLGYRLAQARSRLEPTAGLALCRRLAEVVEPNEARVLDAIAREAEGDPVDERGLRVREIEVDRLLEPAGTPDARWWMLSPYVGCLVGCRFCYAQSRLAASRRLLGLAEVPWGSYVDARVNAPAVLARELAALPRRPVKFCPIVSDPYHAIERGMGLTRACLEVLARPELAPPATLVLTRAALVERDAELLASIPRAYVGFSVPTEDDGVRRHFEPRGAPIEERARVLRALRSSGVRTFAVVQPVLTDDVAALAAFLAGCVDSVRIDVLRGVEGAADDFADPRFEAWAGDDVQEARAAELAERLVALGVDVWPEELPVDLEPSR